LPIHVTPSLGRDAVTPRSENSAPGPAPPVADRASGASEPSGHCVLQLQERRLRGRAGSRPSRLISLGNFPPRPNSKRTVRWSVLRMICGSRPLPMVPPRVHPKLSKTGSARLRQTGRWQYPQPSTRHQEIRHWLPVPASQSDHNQMRGLPNLQRTVGGVAAKTFFAHSHGGIAHFSRGVMCRDESRYRSV
jgi:hypothetical protein